MTRTNSDRMLIVDFFRVIAIFMVLFSHILFTIGSPWLQMYQPSFGIHPFFWSSWGEIGVTIFLVLSGISLEFTYGGKHINFDRFYVKRILRIYPIYYMSLLLGLMMHAAFACWGSLRHGAPFTLLPDFGYFDLFLALSGFNAFFGKWGGPLVGSSWFIGLIMVLYFCYPAISWACRKSPWACIAFLLCICVISRTLMKGSTILPGHPMEWFPPNRLFEFGLGVFFARVINYENLRSFNGILQRLPYLTTLSALSFPLFLIHDPLRRFIVISLKYTTSLSIGITVFLVLSLFLSKLAFIVDQRLQGTFVSLFFQKAGSRAV